MWLLYVQLLYLGDKQAAGAAEGRGYSKRVEAQIIGVASGIASPKIFWVQNVWF